MNSHAVNHLSDLKWQYFLNLSYVCQILAEELAKGQKESYQSTNITLIFTRPLDLFLVLYF